MARKRTREELENALQRSEETDRAKSLLIKSLAPKAGWTFVESPKGFAASLIFVDETGYVAAHHDVLKGRDEFSKLSADLYRIHSGEYDGGTESPHMRSLLAAIGHATAFRSRMFPQMKETQL